MIHRRDITRRGFLKAPYIKISWSRKFGETALRFGQKVEILKIYFLYRV